MLFYKPAEQAATLDTTAYNDIIKRKGVQEKYMEKEYVLKHKEIPVVLFRMDDENYKILGIDEILESERLPFSLGKDNNKVQCAIKLYNWISGRGLADSRKDMSRIKEKHKAKSKEELMVRSFGLNLTDHYWLHKTEENRKWADLNFFDNFFDKLKAGGKANPDIDETVGNRSPNFCVDGSIEKRWIIIENDIRVLLKGSRYKRMQEPFNEAVATKILNEFGIECVAYSLKRTEDNNIPYSECRCMVDRNCEYLNALFVMESEDYERKEPYVHYLNMCKKNGLNDAKNKIDEMIALDFIIGNDDRHRGNFGIIRNADTLEWLKIAPIFDNGNCLFFDQDNDDMEYFGIDSLGTSFGGSNRLCLNYIDFPDWYDSAKGKKIADIVEYGLNDNERLRSERVEKVTGIVRERVRIFEKEIGKKR